VRHMTLLIALLVALPLSGCKEDGLYRQACELYWECYPEDFADFFGEGNIDYCVDDMEGRADLHQQHGSDCMEAWHALLECEIDVGCYDVSGPNPCESEYSEFEILCDVGL
jgi:hypothetical protein